MRGIGWTSDARSYARYMLDILCVALSPLLALLIRDNFNTSVLRLEALAPYALLCILVGAIVFGVVRLHRSMWRYTSLVDILHVIGTATVVLLVALAASFYLNRMENIARSLPVIQWLLLISLMAGARVSIRLWGERSGRSQSNVTSAAPEQVLLVGVSDVTELYLRSVNEFAQGHLAVVGILASGPRMTGRLIRMHKVLGRPEDVQKVLSELDLHGVAVERIIVMQPFEQLSRDAQKALLVVANSATVEVDWLVEKLGLRGRENLGVRGGENLGVSGVENLGVRGVENLGVPSVERLDLCADGASESRCTRNAVHDKSEYQHLDSEALLSLGQYHAVKRAIDGIGAIFIILVLAPIFALLAVMVAIDVGFPLMFWQLRPGRHGRRFKLFKFRTMHSGHDVNGNRVLDQLRSSNIGNLLRRSRLDELPQLYNILVGEMSFVGPRPLLPVDQPQWQASRLVVRPGLTGWAQVNGGRDISPEDKAALDIWYIVNASLWLDISILLRTLVVLILGERVNCSAVQAAHSTLEKIKTKWTAGNLLTPSSDSGLVVSAGGAQEAP